MKQRIFANVPDASLFMVKQDDRSIRWEKKGKEFYMHGEMYDVVRIKKINGKVYLFCINDKKEQKLIHGFAKLVKSQTDNSGKNKRTIKPQVTDYVLNKYEKPNGPFIDHNRHYFSFNAAIASFEKEVNAPPPRC